MQTVPLRRSYVNWLMPPCIRLYKVPSMQLCLACLDVLLSMHLRVDNKVLHSSVCGPTAIRHRRWL